MGTLNSVVPIGAGPLARVLPAAAAPGGRAVPGRWRVSRPQARWRRLVTKEGWRERSSEPLGQSGPQTSAWGRELARTPEEWKI